MTKKAVTLDDIAASIAHLQATVSGQGGVINSTQRAVSGMQGEITGMRGEIAGLHKTVTENSKSIDDLGGSIVDMGSMVTEAITASENRLRAELSRTNEHIASIESENIGIHTDVGEIYHTIYNLRQDFGVFRDEQDSNVRNLDMFANKVSLKLDIPYKA